MIIEMTSTVDHTAYWVFSCDVRDCHTSYREDKRRPKDIALTAHQRFVKSYATESRVIDGVNNGQPIDLCWECARKIRAEYQTALKHRSQTNFDRLMQRLSPKDKFVTEMSEAETCNCIARGQNCFTWSPKGDETPPLVCRHCKEPPDYTGQIR